MSAPAAFYKKVAASDMPLMAALGAAGVPAKVCGAKFRGEKEEQGSGRMTLFCKKSVGAKRTLQMAAPGRRGPRGSLRSKISWGSEEQQNERAMIFYKKIVASDMSLATSWCLRSESNQ